MSQATKPDKKKAEKFYLACLILVLVAKVVEVVSTIRSGV